MTERVREEEAQIELHPVGESQFFKISGLVHPPGEFLWVTPLGGALSTVAVADQDPQSHFSLTPYNNGEYFKIAPKAWPDAPICIRKSNYYAYSQRVSENDTSTRIGITIFVPPVRRAGVRRQAAPAAPQMNL